MKTLGVIDVSCAPQPLGDRQAARLARRIGGDSLLTQLIRRVTDSERLEGVVAVFSKSEAKQFGLPDLVPSDVGTFIYDSSDQLERLIAALDQYPHDAIIRVGMESPFVDPMLIDALIDHAAAAPQVDYAAYRLRDGCPATDSHLGLFSEWYAERLLRRLHQQLRRSHERQQMTRYLFSHPEGYKLRLIPVPAVLDREDARLLLEELEDWELAEDIVEALGEEGLNCYNLAELVDEHPAIRRRMEALNQAGKVL